MATDEQGELTGSTTVPCPTCGTPVAWGPQSPWRPFCSERCRLIDLGEWFEEQHRIPGETSFPPEGNPEDDE